MTRRRFVAVITFTGQRSSYPRLKASSVFRQGLRFGKTNSFDKRLDWVMFGGRKIVPTA
ncbi:hypothetical protein ISN44_As07g022790 [Arabidopsis suecica]|uniref:Uncharacterized protein n=1 Tax=Arabidopsis suecica TaxID=45249 RepID=A0A8T2C3K2_ARASU|nr:hypothetical protein ISN44_As07g022790 [Arabidopsis suecica]